MVKIIILIALSVSFILIGTSIPTNQLTTTLSSSGLTGDNPKIEFAFRIKTSEFDFFVKNGILEIAKDGQVVNLYPYKINGVSNFELFLGSWKKVDPSRYIPPENCQSLLIKINNPVERFGDFECLNY